MWCSNIHDPGAEQTDERTERRLIAMGMDVFEFTTIAHAL
jgi:hypothetical protein